MLELERTLGLGFVGTTVYGPVGETPLDDPALRLGLAAAAALGQPLVTHPQVPAPAVREAQRGRFDPVTDLALATFGQGWHPEVPVELLLFWQDRTDSLSRSQGSSGRCRTASVRTSTSRPPGCSASPAAPRAGGHHA